MSTAAEVTHRAPGGDRGLVPCCGRDVLELPDADAITDDPAEVTCPGVPLPPHPDVSVSGSGDWDYGPGRPSGTRFSGGWPPR